MHGDRFIVKESFRSAEETARREALQRIMDAYLRDQLAAEDRPERG